VRYLRKTSENSDLLIDAPVNRLSPTPHAYRRGWPVWGRGGGGSRSRQRNSLTLCLVTFPLKTQAGKCNRGAQSHEN